VSRLAGIEWRVGVSFTRAGELQLEEVEAGGQFAFFGFLDSRWVLDSRFETFRGASVFVPMDNGGHELSKTFGLYERATGDGKLMRIDGEVRMNTPHVVHQTKGVGWRKDAFRDGHFVCKGSWQHFGEVGDQGERVQHFEFGSETGDGTEMEK
jgi:hypothetical protein